MNSEGANSEGSEGANADAPATGSASVPLADGAQRRPNHQSAKLAEPAGKMPALPVAAASSHTPSVSRAPSDSHNPPSSPTSSVSLNAPAIPPRWYSRGYLPHFEDDIHVQAITFRLHDSVPAKVIAEWRRALACTLGNAPATPASATPGSATDNPTTLHPATRQPAAPQPATLQQRIESELHRRILAYEDAGHGACYLRDPRVADIVQNALLHFDGQRYRLLAWCVMPNHVHVIIEPIAPHTHSQIVHSWKSFTAKEANKHLNRAGDFWMREHHDRYIRNPAHLANAIAYAEDNPVKAGFVASKTDWRWSSAGKHWGGK